MPGWLQSIIDWLQSLSWGQQAALGIGLFLVTFLGSIAVTFWIIVQIPETYFQNSHPPALARKHPVLRWTFRIGKNILGLLLVLLGILLSLPGVPGQGVLTILIGLMLLDFPGKHHLERKLVMRPSVRSAIDRIRERFGKPPLVLDERSPPLQPAISLFRLTDETAQSSPMLARAITCLFLLAAAVAVDIAAGPAHPLWAIYLIPLGLASWHAGRYWGMGLALAGGIAWLLIDPLVNRHRYEHLWLSFEHGTARLILGILVAHFLASLRESRHREQGLGRIDPLTGIANAAQFLELAHRELARSHRNQEPFTIVCLGIDRFKEVNDRFGHLAGDSLLENVARTIRGCIRETDLLARIGGDEFVLFLPETGLEAGEIASRKVQQKLLELSKENDWPVGFTLGVITCLTPPACTPDELIRIADDLKDGARKDGVNGLKHEILSLSGLKKKPEE